MIQEDMTIRPIMDENNFYILKLNVYQFNEVVQALNVLNKKRYTSRNYEAKVTGRTQTHAVKPVVTIEQQSIQRPETPILTVPQLKLQIQQPKLNEPVHTLVAQKIPLAPIKPIEPTPFFSFLHQ
jgi:hypothetical protein